MNRYLLYFLFGLSCLISGCDKDSNVVTASYRIEDRKWTSEQVIVNIYDGFMFVRVTSVNEYGVSNVLYLKVNGTVEGDYKINRSLHESVGFLQSQLLRFDTPFYSSNIYKPDTVNTGQMLTVRSVDKTSQKISLDFDFSVINQSTGGRERVKGSIRDAFYTLNPKIRHSLIEISDNDVFMGTLKSYDGYTMDFSDDNYKTVRVSLPANIATGVHDVTSLPGVLYGAYYITFPFKLSGTVSIQEKDLTKNFIKGAYKLTLTYSDNSTSTHEGFFSASRT
ncbi:MAG: hypothetical protein IPM26_01220 [Saprospiraceae bacterium]|nr:hypothetical protein [Saprospiraceae bacterium]